MQELHLVGFTTDRRNLIFSTRQGAKSGSFLVPVDEDLLAAVGHVVDEAADRGAEADEELDEEVVEGFVDTRVDAKLSVREVQARLRAGEAVHEIAERAGVEPEWVERFAPPIRAEQRQIVAKALTLPMERPRVGPSAVSLREAVARSMAERDVPLTAESFDAAWSSRLLGADLWSVEFSFVNRGRTRTVSWTFDTSARRLTTSDRFASQIGFVAGAPADASRRPATADRASDDPADDGPADDDGQSDGGAGAHSTSPRSTTAKDEKHLARKTPSASRKRAAKKQARAKEPGAAEKAPKKGSPAGKKAAAAKKAAEKKMQQAAAKRTAAAKKAAAKRRKAAARKAIADEKERVERARVAAEKEAAERARAEAEAQAAAEAEWDRAAAEAVAIAERKLAEERAAAEERKLAEEQAAAERRAAEERAAAASAAASADAVRDEGGGEERPVRATSRTVPTARFRSGSAVPASQVNGRLRRTGPDGAVSSDRSDDEADDRPSRAPDGRRPRRTRQLRAR